MELNAPLFSFLSMYLLRLLCNFVQSRVSSPNLSIGLVISLEDHVLLLICKTPIHCQTHLGVISFHFTELPPNVPLAVNISELCF